MLNRVKYIDNSMLIAVYLYQKSKNMKTKKFEIKKMEEIKNNLPKDFNSEIYHNLSFSKPKMKDILLKLNNKKNLKN